MFEADASDHGPVALGDDLQNLVRIAPPPVVAEKISASMKPSIAGRLDQARGSSGGRSRRRPSCRGRTPDRGSAAASRRRGTRGSGGRRPLARLRAPAAGPTRHGRRRSRPLAFPLCRIELVAQVDWRASSVLTEAAIGGLHRVQRLDRERHARRPGRSGRIAAIPSRIWARAPSRSFEPAGRPPATRIRHSAPSAAASSIARRLSSIAAVPPGGIGGREHAAPAHSRRPRGPASLIRRAVSVDAQRLRLVAPGRDAANAVPGAALDRLAPGPTSRAPSRY